MTILKNKIYGKGADKTAPLFFYQDRKEGMQMSNELRKKLLCETFAVVVGLIIVLLPVPNGLEKEAMWTLALLAWAIINWMTNAIPDFVCIFIMCCSWVLLGIVPFSTAFESFSGSTVWLLIAAMGIGAAVTRSGLLARAALWIMKICPPTFKGQVLALLGSGVLIGPFIPSTIAKVSIVG